MICIFLNCYTNRYKMRLAPSPFSWGYIYINYDFSSDGAKSYKRVCVCVCVSVCMPSTFACMTWGTAINVMSTYHNWRFTDSHTSVSTLFTFARCVAYKSSISRFVPDVACINVPNKHPIWIANINKSNSYTWNLFAYIYLKVLWLKNKMNNNSTRHTLNQ